jgi:hypothetical protein
MSSRAAPTERQLRYLRSLASRTATTFLTPASRGEASREIDRLRRLQAAPRERDSPEEIVYATAAHEDELTGFGATRSWRSRPPSRTARPVLPRKGASALARYELSGGTRLIEGIRTREGMTLRDVPACGDGPGYMVETLSGEEAERELPALLADYLRRARELDAVPMSSHALELLCGAMADD